MIKKVYSYDEAMVSDDVINAEDSVIDAVLPDFRAGANLYCRIQKS